MYYRQYMISYMIYGITLSIASPTSPQTNGATYVILLFMRNILFLLYTGNHIFTIFEVTYVIQTYMRKHMLLYMRNLLGWLEARLAQHTLTTLNLKIARITLNNKQLKLFEPA